ncbi:MAG: amino acid--tRNA ligase-related protein, partial [Myxococcota bacterium]
ATDFLRCVVQQILQQHERELTDVLGRDIAVLQKVHKPFVRLTYDEALTQLAQLQQEESDPVLKQQLDISWGMDFGSPHETALCRFFDRPLVVTHFPAQTKAFYMKQHPDDQKLSCSFDVLAPDGYGEIIGGGQREDDMHRLLESMKQHKLPQEQFQWYVDLRRYGSVKHAGFGLGLERLVAFVCGLAHVRETIAFPRTLERLTP